MYLSLVRRSSSDTRVYRASVEHPEEVLEWTRRENLLVSTLEESVRQDDSSSSSMVSRWTVEHALQLSRSSHWQTRQSISDHSWLVNDRTGHSIDVSRASQRSEIVSECSEGEISRPAGRYGVDLHADGSSSNRFGAIHTLVFEGFSANELAVGIKHSQPKLLITGKRRRENLPSFSIHANSRL